MRTRTQGRSAATHHGQLAVRIVERDGKTIVQATGELDLDSAEAFEHVVEDLADGGRRVELDLSGIDFIDAAGFSALLCTCVLPCGESDVHVVAASPAIDRMVKLALEITRDPSRTASPG